MCLHMGGGTFFKVGGAQVHVGISFKLFAQQALGHSYTRNILITGACTVFVLFPLF